MAESSSISMPQHASPPETDSTVPQPVMVDKTLGSAANLVKLLPCGTVIAFQALSPSFTNRGTCNVANMYLTAALIGLCSLSCCFFAFTDSFLGSNGKVYYGISTFKGFYIFNYHNSEGGVRNMRLHELSKFKVSFVDFIHAFFSCLVFLSVYLGESDVQNCLFSGGGVNTKELLVNLPLGVGFLSSLVFLIFPMCRKGIGYSESAHPPR